MNWVDILIIVLLIVFALEGLGKSFIGETVNLISFILALFLSLTFYSFGAVFYESSFNLPHSLANVLGFATIWFLVETIFFILITIFYKGLKFLAPLDQKLIPFSVIPAFLRGLIFISILLVLVGTFPIQPKVKGAVNNSKVGKYLLTKTGQLEAPFKNVFGGITNDSLTFFTIKPETDESVDLKFTTHEFSPNESLENMMIELVNKERTTRGLKALKYNSKLKDIAREHSADMFERGYFSHYTPEGKNVADRAQAKNYEYLVIGENLAYAPNLELAHTGLMNSPGHRANILSKDFNQIAIGVMDSPDYGLMVTQVFSN